MEKVFCMQVAAQLTVAACNGIGSGLSGGRPIDAALQDPNQRAINLEVWEIFRAYYSAITQALTDSTSWPAPAVPQGTAVPDIISSGISAALPALASALGAGPLGAMLQSVLKLLSSQPQKPAAPPIVGTIPNPGVAGVSHA